MKYDSHWVLLANVSIVVVSFWGLARGGTVQAYVHDVLLLVGLGLVLYRILRKPTPSEEVTQRLLPVLGAILGMSLVTG